MNLFTVHETKRNQIGTFRRRVLGIKQDGVILLVTPCIKPECPDLGFSRVLPSELEDQRFKDNKPLEALDKDCIADLIKKLQGKELAETDLEFSKKWFDEIAEATQLATFRLPFTELIQQERE